MQIVWPDLILISRSVGEAEKDYKVLMILRECLLFFFVREKVLEKEREEKWKKMEALCVEREGGGMSSDSPTKSGSDQDQGDDVVLENSKDEAGEEGSDQITKEDAKDSSETDSSNVNQSDT